MSKQWENLFLVLDDILNLYHAILTLSKRKKDILIAANAPELEKITKQEELLILQIGKLDEARNRIIAELFQTLEVTEEPFSLSRLKALAEPEGAKKLEAFQGQLEKLNGELLPLNQLNTELLQQALSFINYNINILSQSTVGPTYAGKGKTEQTAPARTMFDAKV